ncbi:MAG: TIGR01841 family phasin [Caulobacteraceae bacterium]
MTKATAIGDQALREGMDKSLNTLNELNAQSKRNLEAVVASVTAATKGAEALSAQAMAYTKKAVEGQVEQARALTGARSVQEVVELQTTYAKSALESYVAELNRLSETLSGAVKESFRPLNERATAVVETLQAVR